MPDNKRSRDRLLEALERAQGIAPDKTRYSSLGLDRNPFPFASISAPEEVSLLPPITEDERGPIEDFLNAPKPAILWISGEYGGGKTHLLLWFQQLINAKGGGQLSAYYVANPGKTPAELVQNFMAAVGGEELGHKIRQLVIRAFREDAGKRGLQKVLTDIRMGQSLLLPKEVEALTKRLLDDKFLINDVDWMNTARVLFSQWDGLIQYGGGALGSRGIGPPEVCDDFVAFAFGSSGTERHAWAALIGGRKRAAPKPEQKFGALLEILIASGFRKIFLLVDEMEDLLLGERLTRRERTDYLSTLRVLLDDSLRNLGVVLAGTEAAWDKLNELTPAVKGRTPYRVVLPRLSKSSAPVLVSNFLNTARKSGSTASQPFSTEAISALLKHSEANRRRFIALCYHAVEYGADRKRKEIRADDVEAVAKRLPL